MDFFTTYLIAYSSESGIPLQQLENALLEEAHRRLSRLSSQLWSTFGDDVMDLASPWIRIGIRWTPRVVRGARRLGQWITNLGAGVTPAVGLLPRVRNVLFAAMNRVSIWFALYFWYIVGAACIILVLWLLYRAYWPRPPPEEQEEQSEAP
ncbi:hypothetical protein PCL_01922 [Purpureocillium lilacinum]|uniref:Uncharacterized protein n=1 Tax=Purpureocillium lilacinum TaxID=33203 RepID=A0A2U3DNY0_PURLI|nr:hypothetical protein PCL_01922 [Purpureocillium lilacinum]